VITKTRTEQTYYSKITQKAPATQLLTKKVLQKFDSFCKANYNSTIEKIVTEMKQSPEEAVYDVLQEWINWVDLPNSIKLYFTMLKPYLYYRGIKLNSLDVKLNLVFPKKHEVELHGMSEEEYRKILEVANYRNKTLYLVMGSSGLRPVEASHIRICDLELMEGRYKIHVPAKWTKLKRDKTTFCSVEATKFLKPILRGKNDNDYVFGTTTGTIDKTFLRYCKKIGLDNKYEHNKVNKLTPMSFRAWFITKVSRHDPNLAKKWAGQKGYLLQYDRLEAQEMLQKYIEFEPDLIIDTSEKLKAENEKLKKEKSELENKTTKIQTLEDNLAKVTHKLDLVMQTLDSKSK